MSEGRDVSFCVFMGCVGGLVGILSGGALGTIYGGMDHKFKQWFPTEELKVECFPSGKEYYSPEHGYKEAEQIDIHMDRTESNEEQSYSGCSYSCSGNSCSSSQMMSRKMGRTASNGCQSYSGYSCSCSGNSHSRSQMMPRQDWKSQAWNECYSSGCQSRGTWNRQPQRTKRSKSSNPIFVSRGLKLLEFGRL